MWAANDGALVLASSRVAVKGRLARPRAVSPAISAIARAAIPRRSHAVPIVVVIVGVCIGVLLVLLRSCQLVVVVLHHGSPSQRGTFGLQSRHQKRPQWRPQQ